MERLKEERQKRLRSLVHVAKEKSSWHRERLRNVDADSITEADLTKLPVMTKPELMANFDQIVTDKRLTLEMVNAHVSSLREDRYLLDNYHVIASGGTSGFRGVFVYGWDEWITYALAFRPFFLSVNPILWRLLSFRPIGKIVVDSRIKRNKARKPESKGGIVAVAADIASHGTRAMTSSLFYPFISGRTLPATLPIREIVEGLNSAQPDYLGAYASILYQLALEAKTGRLHITPKRINSTSEPLFPYIRKAVRDAWGLPVGNIWGTSEGSLGWSCGKSEGMHLNEDMNIIEPVDENGRPVPPGVTASKIYLTSLFNQTLPLIRYEMSDQVKFLDDGPCPCGATFRRVEDIQGRLEDIFTYPSGVTVHPIVFASAFQHHSTVVEYQVRQTPRGASVVLVANGPVNLERLESDIREYLTGAGVHAPEVSAEIVEKLERTAGAGKLKRFVPLPGSGPEVTLTPEVIA